MTAAPSAAAALTRSDALPSGPNDFNLYSGLIAGGLGLAGCLLARYSNGGHGPRPRGDALSWLVHTRLGPGPKSWMGRQLDLGVLLSATYGELLVVSVYVAWLTIRFAFYMQRYSEAETTALRVGKAFGRLGAPMILMTYLLAQRFSIWSWVAGIPHERLIAYHNFHAWALYGVFVAHMVCMAVALRTRIDGQVIVRQLSDTVDAMQVNPRFGVAAFVLWTWVMVTSLSVFRRKAWGVFYAGHFVFLPAAVMTLLHTRPANGAWLIPAAVTFFVDLLIRGYMKLLRKSEVRDALVLPGGVAKLVVSTGNRMAYEPGQYVWIAFALKDGPEALQSLSFHPYSISSAHAAGDTTYSLHIKTMGPGTWSDAVVAAAAQGAASFKGSCRVGGPAGRLSIDPTHFERIVLVAGGVGFTPLVSLLVAIVRDAAASEGTKEAPAARSYAAVKHITVVWAVQTVPCLSWFADELDAARAATNVAVDVQLYVTRAAKAEDAEGQGGFVAGRPDVAASLAGAAAQQGAGPVGVYACGPAHLLEDTRNAVAAANAGVTDTFLLHQETFEF